MEDFKNISNFIKFKENNEKFSLTLIWRFETGYFSCYLSITLLNAERILFGSVLTVFQIIFNYYSPEAAYVGCCGTARTGRHCI